MNATKVEVLDNEWHHIHYKGKVYLAGAEMTIPKKDFDPKVWKSLEKPKAAKEAEVPSESKEEKGEEEKPEKP